MSRLKHIYNYFYQENLMSEKGLTTINLKKINRSKVYQYIYKTHQTSKMQIVQDLQMGLSTVSQNLNLLEKEGLLTETDILIPQVVERPRPSRSSRISGFPLESGS